MEYILGKNDADVKGGLLHLSDAERRQHIHVIGSTGSGKSALFYNFLRSDFERGRGFALLDPHGDLALSIADASPRIMDTIYFDPLAARTLSYNPLYTVSPLHRGTVASHIVSSFKHIWAGSWGPRLEYILTNAIRLLLENNSVTLVDLPRLLTDTQFRNLLLRQCHDPFITAFWKDEYNKYSEKLRAEAIAPLQNKVGAFANNPVLRAIIGQPSTIDIPRIMNERKVLLANLSKRMGAEPSHLLGALLTTGFAQGAEARAGIAEEDRVDFSLYADEFQNFATESFSHILSEARKYRLNLVLAHQYLDQLPEDLKHAVLGNTGTVVVFRIGAFDAPIMSKHLGIPEHVLTTLPNYHAYVRILRDGAPSTYRIEMLPPNITTGSLKGVLNHSETRYARDRGK